jgi:type VI secretion system secreted protein VgrG
MKLLRAVSLLVVLVVLATSAYADSILGSADAFGVLGASTVTNTGASVVFQDLGVWPGNSITGFPPGIVLGAIHDSDAVAMQAQADALTGYNYLAGLAMTQNLTGQDLGGLSLNPGVYFFASSAQMTGTLNLDFHGMSNMTVVFQIGSTLTTSSASMVNIINPGMNDQVYWQVGSSATLGTTTDFVGSIIAEQSITMNTGASIDCGRAIALNGAVTMDTNNVDTGNCASTPEPGTISLLGSGIVAAAATAWPTTLQGLWLGGLAGLRRKMRRQTTVLSCEDY